ncbi:MAG: hypothetical protein AB1513_05705 [Pseudomonadota bacterium]
MGNKPTIASRLQKRFIVMSGDAGLVAALRAALPEGWQMTETARLDALGDFAEILQHRFMLLDLGEGVAFDPLAVIRRLRGELMLNVPVFCFGGSVALRDEARLNRADRFFERHEIVEKMRLFCVQYGW